MDPELDGGHRLEVEPKWWKQDVNEISLTLSSIEMLSVILTPSQCFEMEIPKCV